MDFYPKRAHIRIFWVHFGQIDYFGPGHVGEGGVSVQNSCTSPQSPSIKQRPAVSFFRRASDAAPTPHKCVPAGRPEVEGGSAVCRSAHNSSSFIAQQHTGRWQFDISRCCKYRNVKKISGVQYLAGITQIATLLFDGNAFLDERFGRFQILHLEILRTYFNDEEF